MFITTDQKFGRLRIKVPQDINPGSAKKIEWICDCEKEVCTAIVDVMNGHSTSCGRCKEISAKQIANMKFGKLRINTPQSILPGSNKKTVWICDCGRETNSRIADVLNNKKTSCNNCNEISAEEISKMKFGKLRIKTPKSILPGSNKKTVWICDCGKEKLIQIGYVISGHTVSCNKCNEIPSSKVAQMKFGKLHIKTPQNIKPGAHKKITWICDCGKETIIRVGHVTSGRTRSCGRCKEISAEEVSTRKFGKLRIQKPKSILPSSQEKIKWVCDCGREILKHINNVVSGHTTSCGDCHKLIYDWFYNNKIQIQSLKCPILPDEIPYGGIILLETIKNSHSRFKTICPACKELWTGYWSDIRLGKSLTCGCVANRVSGPQRKIFEFIKNYDSGVQLEYKLGIFHYDIFVPSKNLLIEYDGMLYHNSDYSKEKDLRKHKFALDSGYQFMRILEKDWLKDKNQIYSNLDQTVGEANGVN
jgi:predicted PP-loop superfamily ATPase